MVVCGAGSLAAEAKAHKKKTAAQLFDLQKTGAPSRNSHPSFLSSFLSSDGLSEGSVLAEFSVLPKLMAEQAAAGSPGASPR